jgi:hypothetical protein
MVNKIAEGCIKPETMFSTISILTKTRGLSCSGVASGWPAQNMGFRNLHLMNVQLKWRLVLVYCCLQFQGSRRIEQKISGGQATGMSWDRPHEMTVNMFTR